MSRAYEAPSGRVYFTNGDYSGTADFIDTDGKRVEISVDDILYLAALVVRSHLVGKAETWSDRRILGLPEEES